MTNQFVRSEYTEQVQVINFLRVQYPDVLFNASPAGVRYGKGKEAIIRGGMMKRAGAQAGFPDIFIYQVVIRGDEHKWYSGLAIEMKREKGGQVSPEQQQWIDKLNEHGYKAIVAHGYDEAVKAINEYLR